MGYPRGIDEYTDLELIQELQLRAERRDDGVCDYCERFKDEPECKFPTRHSMAMKKEEDVGYDPDDDKED